MVQFFGRFAHCIWSRQWLLLHVSLVLFFVANPAASQSTSTTGGSLNYLPALEAFRAAPPMTNGDGNNDVNPTTTAITRASSITPGENVDLIGANNQWPELEGKSICHFVELNRYSAAIPNKEDPTAPTKLSTFPSSYPLECLAAVVLAMEHLNTGDGSVVPEIEGLDQRCPIRFTGEFADTQGSETVALDRVISAVTQPNQQKPCAFQGAFRSQENIGAAMYTSLKGYPQVSTLTSAPELNNRDIYPLYGSLNPANAARPLLQFLVHQLGINHIAVVHSDNASGLNWINPMRQAMAEFYPNFTITAVPYSQGTTNFEATVTRLKETGIRYIYSLASTREFEALITEAHSQGIAGVPTSSTTTTDNKLTATHTWITWVGIATTFLQGKEFRPDDTLYLATKNMLIYDATLRSMPGLGRYDAFLEARSKMANPTDLAYLQSKVPTYTNQPGYNPTFTNATVNSAGRFTGTAAVLYDATIALGLGACAAAKVYNNNNNNMSNTFDGATHFQGFLNASFVGASGLVQLDKNTGARDATSNLYGISNMVAQPTATGSSSSSSSNMTIMEVKTHYYDMGKWVQDHDIIFADGSNEPHAALPPAERDTHTIGVGLRSVGFAMGAIALMASVGCGVWTFWYREHRIVKASQPIFLLLICLGTFLMGTSIFPMSLDDEIIEDSGGINAACMSIPWLLSLGWCFSFSALFSKTRRVNIIFHNPSFRRVKVDAIDVMKPMIVLLVLNVIILGLWTGIAPLEWDREVTGMDQFGRPTTSVGECTSDKIWQFMLPLALINLVALLFAIHQAYAARKIATEFAESDWIARAMSFIVLVSLVTLPVLLIVEEDTGAAYFVSCALVFVVCISILGFIFGPKMWEGARNKLRKSQVRISGTKMFSETSQTDGALILEHPATNERYREELKELRALKKEWEQERASKEMSLVSSNALSFDGGDDA